jgi:hypothetical protein
MPKLLIPVPTKVRSSETLKTLLWALLVSRWRKDDFDGRKLLVSPLAKVRSSERRKFILPKLLVSHRHKIDFEIRKSLIPPHRDVHTIVSTYFSMYWGRKVHQRAVVNKSVFAIQLVTLRCLSYFCGTFMLYHLQWWRYGRDAGHRSSKHNTVCIQRDRDRGGFLQPSETMSNRRYAARVYFMWHHACRIVVKNPSFVDVDVLGGVV